MKAYKLLWVIIILIVYFPNFFAQISNQENRAEKLEISTYSDTVKAPDGSLIHIWSENSWINVERIDKNNNLLFRVLLFHSNSQKPNITQDETTIRVSSNDGQYFIDMMKYDMGKYFDYSIISGVQEETISDTSAYFNPYNYDITFNRPISSNDQNMLLMWEKDGWQYITTGHNKDNRIVGIYRIKHSLLSEGRNKGLSMGFEAFDEHHFYWNGKLFYAEQQPSSFSDSIVNKYINKPPPFLSVVKWYNKTEFDSFSQLKGKVVIIYFWATWCPPCLRNIPILNYYYQKYKDKGLVVIGAHHYKASEDLDEYLALNKEIKFPICIATQKTLKEFGVDLNIPKYFILDREGKIINAFVEKLPIEERIKELLD